MRSIRIAVVGAGLIGRRHVEAISRSAEARVASLVDPHPSAADFAAARSIDRHLSLSDMLALDRPDGVIVATPNQMHLENGLECIGAGIPVLIEKPIADDVRSARRLVDEASYASIPILVGHHRRHNPIVRAAKQKIDSGTIGDVVAVQGLCWLYKPDDYFDAAWRTRQGAGPVFINLIHDIDLLRYLLGEVRSVQAFEAKHTRGHEIEDTAAIILHFAGGALATLSVSDTIVSPWSWELTAEENPAYPATRQNCYFIGGTRGSLELPGGRIWSQEEKRSWWEPIDGKSYKVGKRDPLDLQISHFCEIISRNTEPLVSGLEGLRSLQVIEAIKESAGSGKLVHLSRHD